MQPEETKQIILTNVDLDKIVREAVRSEMAEIKGIIKEITPDELTQGQIMKLIGISRRTLHYWERTGKIKRINEVGKPLYNRSQILKIKKQHENK